MTYLLLQASAHRIPLRDESVQTCVTSPPYWGLRAYAGEQSFVWGGDDHEHEWGEKGTRKSSGGLNSTSIGNGAGQGTSVGTLFEASTGAYCTCGAWYGALGLEPTPDLFVAHMVEVFREVRRVLRKDGTLWLNLGDSYATGTSTPSKPSANNDVGYWQNADKLGRNRIDGRSFGLKPKDLVGIPWRVAFALQADGWYLRSDIVWAKPNPMPESVTDRPTKSHEYVFLLSKSERYFYDATAIREEAIHEGRVVKASNPETAKNAQKGIYGATSAGFSQHDTLVSGRNARSVWNIATQPYPGAHFATFPEELPERCIKAGSAAQACAVCGAPWQRVTERHGGERYATGKSSEKNSVGLATAFSGYADGSSAPTFVTLGFEPTCAHDARTVGSVVLDPFNGSGTTGRVAMRLGRRYVGLDMSREYLTEQAIARIDPLADARRKSVEGGQQVMPL